MAAAAAAALNLNLRLLLAVNFLCIFPFLISPSESQIAPSPNAVRLGNQSQAPLSVCDHEVINFFPPGYRRLKRFKCAKITDSVHIKYLPEKENVTTIVLSITGLPGWCGLGFSNDGGMVGSTAVVGWPGNDKVKPGIAKFFLRGKGVDDVVSFEGDDYFNFSTATPPFVVTNNRLFYMGFQAKFGATLGVKQYLIFAAGNLQPTINRNASQVWLTNHSSQAVVQVDFQTGFDIGKDNETNGREKMIHGVLGIVGWGTILPVGAFIPRHLKPYSSKWFNLHMGVQIVGFGVGLSCVTLGAIVHREEEATTGKFFPHGSIGFFVLSLAILQVMAVVARPATTSKWRRYWNWYHYWVGRLVLLIGAVNVIHGLTYTRPGSPLRLSYAIIFFFLVIAITCLEASVGVKTRTKYRKSDSSSVFRND